MSYAYLFKYIIIGDTGTLLLCFSLLGWDIWHESKLVCVSYARIE